MPAHYIGVDVGTRSARACIMNNKGDLLAYASEDISQWQSQENFYEQSASDIWSSVCVAVKAATAKSGIDRGSVRSIAFAATCSLAVFTSDTGKPVSMAGPDSHEPDHNIILWMDLRALKEAENINATKHHLLNYLGGGVSPLMQLPKVLWLKHNLPVNIFNKCIFYDLNDALAYIATGSHEVPCGSRCDERSLSIGTDGVLKGCTSEFLATIGLEELTATGFAQVGGVCKHGKSLPGGSPLGTLCEAAAQDLGLPVDVAVGSGLIDCYAAWVGSVGTPVTELGLIDEPDLHARLASVAGTSTCHIATSRRPLFAEGVWGPYEDHIIPDCWMAQGGQPATGHLLQSILEIHPAYAAAIACAKSQSLGIFDYLNEQLRKIQGDLGAPNISFYGRYYFFYGDLFGNRSPLNDPRMSGSVVGVTGDRSIKNLTLQYYGAMEFLAIQTRHIVAEMRKAGYNITTIFLSGSQTKNDILIKLIATACDMPVVVSQNADAAACRGAATLAFKAVVEQEGAANDLWSVMKCLGKPGRVFHPSKEVGMKALLDTKYTVFLEQCERQREFRRMVDVAIVSST